MSGWQMCNWLVTGASSGFGRAIVEAVLAHGGRVAAASRNPDAFADLVAVHGNRLVPVSLDVGNAASLTRGLAEAEIHLSTIDVLVNNAGYGLLGAIEETSEAEYRALFEVNFFGLVALTKAVLPGMRTRNKGFVVNFSSVSGVLGPAGSGFYAASKFAVEGFSESLRREVRPLGIETMVVEPGPFRTGFFGGARQGTAKRVVGYAEVEKRRGAVSESAGTQPGDPVRGTTILLEAMASKPPPERLVLGAVAVKAIEKAHESRLAEVRAWAARSLEADFPTD